MKNAVVWFGISLLGGLAAHQIKGVSVGWVMFGLLVILPLMGLFITLDDDLPGGWSNPNGDIPPPWKHRDFWGVLLLRTSMSWVGFAIDHGWNSSDGAIFWAIAILGGGVGVFLVRPVSPVKVGNDG